MPSPKSTHRRVQDEKNRRGRLLNEKSSSFHDQISDMATPQLRRPKTVPDMASFKNTIGTIPATELRPKLTKLLLNVTIQGSVGAIHVVKPLESAVKDLVAAAIQQYGKEGLGREEKLMALGSRNFFLCRSANTVDAGGSVTTSSASCSKQAEKVSRTGFSWLKFMNFLL